MRLAFENVSFRYGATERWIIDSLSFSAESGSIVAFVGPSGCGKSTVLDLIGGMRNPQHGYIRWSSGSVDLAAVAASWVVQSNPVLAGRTALDNAAVALVGQGMHIRDARLRAIPVLRELGLEARAGAKVAELSGGEVQRVTIARCLLAPAPILIADEPTGQLDAESTSLVYDALRAAASSSRIVVVATHDPWLAERCDKQVVLRRGDEYAVRPFQ